MVLPDVPEMRYSISCSRRGRGLKERLCKFPFLRFAVIRAVCGEGRLSPFMSPLDAMLHGSRMSRQGFEREYALAYTKGRFGPNLTPVFLQPNIDEANQKQEFAQILTCFASSRSWSSSVLPVTRLRGFRS